MGKNGHHVLNSKQLADDLASITIQDHEYFVSHDVVSLFTNTPVDKTMEIIRQKLKNDKTLRLRTRLSVDDLMELVEFILTTTYFTCKGNIYQQKKGVAMGSPLSPVAVNLFMEWLEEEAINTAPEDCKPRMWKRYVDDVLEIVDRGQIQPLTDHLNQVGASSSLLRRR